MVQKSNLDIAYELVLKKKAPVEFNKLWQEVSQIQGFSEEEANAKIGKFYTNLSLDGRFITLGENTWDLRERYVFEKVHIDMNDVYRDVEEEADEDLESEDEDGEKDYDEDLDSDEETEDEEDRNHDSEEDYDEEY